MTSSFLFAAMYHLGLLPIALTAAIITHESNGNEFAVSSKGAKGLMQLTPIAVKDVVERRHLLPRACELVVDEADMFDPFDNLIAGKCYYLLMLKDFNGDHDMAIRAYNAGPGRVKEWISGKRKLPPETIKYHKRVTKTWNKLKGVKHEEI